jgi:hypothetical protein
MYVSSAYFNVNLGIDIVCQTLSVFKIVILLLIVIAGAFDAIIFLLLSDNTFLIRMGCTQWENSCP